MEHWQPSPLRPRWSLGSIAAIRSDSASKTCRHGSDLHLDGPGAICRLDSPQLAGFFMSSSRSRPPGPTIRERILSRLAALGEGPGAWDFVSTYQIYWNVPAALSM